MWLLPPDIPGAHLPDGVHLLPGHYGREERDLLLVILRRVLPADTRTFVLESKMADAAIARGARFPDALVLVHGEAPGGGLRERVAALGVLGARHLLVQPLEGDEGTAWLEGALKVPLVEWVRQELRRPDHPLAAFDVGHLKVREAAAATADPVTFLRMVERAIEHRLRFVIVGTKPEDWTRSLRVAAPDRLKLKTESTAVEAATPHRRLLHMAREIALLAVDSTWSCGWDVDDRNEEEHHPFGKGDALTRSLLEATWIRSVGWADQVNRRSAAAQTLARLRRYTARTERTVSERASFAAEALGFITASVPEMLARRDEIVAWVASWSSLESLRVWQRHCVGNAALALAHALLRGRRTAEDVGVAKHLLARVDTLSAERRGGATDALRVCASFCAEGEVPEAEDDSPVRVLYGVERGEVSGFAPREFERPVLKDLFWEWNDLATSGRTSRQFFWTVHQWGAPADFLRVTEYVVDIALGRIDDAIVSATRLAAHAELTIERAFAHEVIGTAQALRGSTDAALEAFLAARETYVSLADPLRLANVDAQIAALRAAG